MILVTCYYLQLEKQILKEKVEDLEQHDHINNEKTLLDSDISSIHSNIVSKVEKRFNTSLR